MTRIVVVGDSLLDRDVHGDVTRVCPDAPVPVFDVVSEHSRAGGAGLAAMLGARTGAAVTLVTALARDASARELHAHLAGAGIRIVDVGLEGATPEKVRLRANETSVVRIDRAAAVASRVLGDGMDAVAAVLADADAVLVSDYGRGVADHDDIRAHVSAVAATVPTVWDPHPRGCGPLAGMTVVTPNLRELHEFAVSPIGSSFASITDAARRFATSAAARFVAVTLGARGALVVGADGPPLVVPADPVAGHDTCGAGDAFASAAVAALGGGAVVSEAIEHATRAAGQFVAAGAAGGMWTERVDANDRRHDRLGPSAGEVVERVRAHGGTVVATGGCFDLLHAGHVAMLRAARSLGDCLVVLLNSDRSVRRLKGSDRPLQPVADRAAVLRALECVDAVAVFDSETPVPALETLRPDVFAKGGDYGVADLPETEVMTRLGGQVVVLPYLAGRSTTRLVEEATRRGR